MGFWVIYGLGSEFEDLFVFVVLFLGGGMSGGVVNWLCGFLLGCYVGVFFWKGKELILNFVNFEGVLC